MTATKECDHVKPLLHNNEVRREQKGFLSSGSTACGRLVQLETEEMGDLTRGRECDSNGWVGKNFVVV